MLPGMVPAATPPQLDFGAPPRLALFDRPWAARLAWATMGAVAWAVLVASAWLRPDARGFGTHQQLGLPPCTFQAMTHVPCPGCGLTTSFAYMAHGHILRAFGAHLMGPFLFAITLAVALLAPWALRRAYPLTRVVEHPATTAAFAIALVAGMITFGARLVHTFL